jgi:hypothetical protein
MMDPAAGSIRRDVTGAPVRTLVVYTTTEIRIIVINPTAAAISLPLAFADGIGAKLKATAAYRTSALEDFASVALPVQSSGTWTMQLPTLSLTSFLFART